MDSREKVLGAALAVFSEKGKHGARMEEIAQRARVNKAMVYYFFASKENLFKEVLAHALRGIFERLHQTLQASGLADLSPVECVKFVVQKHFEAFAHHLPSTKIVLEAFVHDPGEIKRALDHAHSKTCQDNVCLLGPKRMTDLFEAGISKKLFRPIDVPQLVVSILGMNLIYFAARPIAQMLLGSDIQDEKRFLKERQESITDLLLHGILEKEVAGHA